MRTVSRLALGLSLVCLLGSGQVARGDPVVMFDKIDSATYFFQNQSAALDQSSTAASVTLSPADIGVDDRKQNPMFTGMVGMTAAGNTLTVKASRAVDNGTLTRAVFGVAKVTISAEFHVVADPSDFQGLLYQVSERDALAGLLRTNATGAGNSSTAQIVFTTLVTPYQYYSQSLGLDANSVATLTRSKTGVVAVNAPTPDLQFAPGSHDSTVNFDSGNQLLTVVHGGVPFFVTATLEARVLTSGMNTSAASDFFDTGTLTLTASAIPEPGVPILIALGTPCLAVLLLKKSDSPAFKTAALPWPLNRLA